MLRSSDHAGNVGTTIGRGARRAGITCLVIALLAVTVPAAAETVGLDEGFDLVVRSPGAFRVVHDGRTVIDADLRWFGVDGSGAEGHSFAAAYAGDPRVVEGEWIADLELIGDELRTRVMHWPYFHVRPIGFVDARLEVEGSSAGAPGLHLSAATGWTRRVVTVRPHVAVGRAPEVEFEILETTVDVGPFDRRHVGLLRLDRRRAVETGAADTIVWEAGTRANWPLAVVVARTRDSLEFLAGQALFTYDEAGRAERPTWRVPPMCGRCRNPRLEDVRVEFVARDSALRVLVTSGAPASPHPISWDGLRLDGIPMTRFHRAQPGDRHIFDVPLTTEIAVPLARAAVNGTLRVEVLTSAGSLVEPSHVDIVAPPHLDETITNRSPVELAKDLPSSLSPRLVTNWPNPFRDATTIEVDVPDTMDEAFELEPSVRQRLDPSAPPPFGPNPLVRVRVFNVSGKLVALLDESVRETGRFTVQWNGTDGQGRPVAAGAYYVNVQMGTDYSVTKRVVRIGN